MYMPQKPAIYGLKIMALIDSRTSYSYNGYILWRAKALDELTLIRTKYSSCFFNFLKFKQECNRR